MTLINPNQTLTNALINPTCTLIVDVNVSISNSVGTSESEAYLYKSLFDKDYDVL